MRSVRTRHAHTMRLSLHDELLNKDGSRYSLTPDSAMFLTSVRPEYLGSAIEFIHRRCLLNHLGISQKWFARRHDDGRWRHACAGKSYLGLSLRAAMAPMMACPAQLTAKLVDSKADRKLKFSTSLPVTGSMGSHLRRTTTSAHRCA